MTPRWRLGLLAALLAGGGTAGLLLGGGASDSRDRAAEAFPTVAATPSIPLPEECLPLPDEEERPPWFPADLPLPGGSYVSWIPDPPAEGIRQIVFTARGTLDDFVRFVLDNWEAEGWNLGRGEREPGEAESIFFTEDTERYGQFRARAVYCDDAYTEVLLIMVLEPDKVSPADSTPSPR